MKIATTIAPRRDGTVVLHLRDQELKFMPNGEGLLTADVADDLGPRVLELDGFMLMEEEVIVTPEVAVVSAASGPNEFDDTQVATVKVVAASKSITPKARAAAKEKA